MTRTAAVIGLGLIGGSLSAALRNAGWHVRGADAEAGVAAEAVRRQVIDSEDDGAPVDVVFVATPVSALADIARAASPRAKAVSDVGSVKGPVVAAVDAPNFVGGHPMAGSEKSGLDAVRPELFRGATWVLTPLPETDTDAYLLVREAVTAVGAEVVTLDPDVHDDMVATVSHVPHLTASALMSVASVRAADNQAVLRLAAGGFRDMTRIAAGHPRLWTDISLNNAPAIVEGLDRVVEALTSIRDHIAKADSEPLHEMLAEAADARQALPTKQGRPADVTTLAVEIPDRPGALGDVFVLFGQAQVNVEDLEINHAIEGTKGTLLVTVAQDRSAAAIDALAGADITAVEWKS